jgi:ABC-2 type transport system ATP-binding protein
MIPFAGSTGTAMIQLDHVTKLYGSVIGVNDITLSLPPGAYGLLGPNGSGKSTLLSLITGQLRPTLGKVRTLGGRPWNNTRLLRRIGVCPEQDLLYSNVTGLDWVSYLLKLHGLGRREAGRRARQALEQVGLGGAMRQPIGGYSRGMRQRTKLAQVFAHDPELLLLDEPFNGLDPVGRHQMTVLLREWIEAGKGVLLASHILHEVEAITHSFLLICGGRLLASGLAEEVHALLADVPNEIRIRSSDAPQLARRLLETDAVQSLRFVEDGRTLLLATRSPATIYHRLPEWIAGTDIRIEEFRSTDDSLQALFESLLRIHRGRS